MEYLLIRTNPFCGSCLQGRICIRVYVSVLCESWMLANPDYVLTERYSLGVFPTTVLKYLLKDDLELKPQS